MIYGVCISDIENMNYKALIKLMKMSKATEKETFYDEFVEEYEDCDIDEYAYDYESGIVPGYHSLAALLMDMIRVNEGIDISCADPDGVSYLGINADVPWRYNEKTRNLSEEEFSDIIRKYTSELSSKPLDIKFYDITEYGL